MDEFGIIQAKEDGLVIPWMVDGIRTKNNIWDYVLDTKEIIKLGEDK